MRLPVHAAFSFTTAGILYLSFRSAGLALGCLISGILIDLDHLYDYLREHRSLSLKNFFRICYTAQFDRIVLFLHGWEWLLLLTCAAWLTHWNPWITGVLIGCAQHIILDAVANDLNVISYSLLWRWKNRFHFDTVFPRWKHIKYRHR